MATTNKKSAASKTSTASTAAGAAGTPQRLSALARSLGKERPFEVPEEEAFLSVMRTAGALGAAVERLFKAHGLSTATYNVLRILRGCVLTGREHGRACHEIGEQMVTQVPDITRLVDRLEEAGLVERCRCEKDRRVVYVRINAAGLDVLAELDEPLLALHRSQLGHMSRTRLAELCAMLAEAREKTDASLARSGDVGQTRS